MRLQAKVSLAIVMIAFIPLFALGIHAYVNYRADLSASVLNHLESVASIQQSRLTAIMLQNRERLALVSSRTQLRLSLRRHLQTGDEAAVATMNRILQDAALSLPDLVSITVCGHDGTALASTDREQIGRTFVDLDLLTAAASAPVVDRLHRDPAGRLRVYLAGPMVLEGETLGVVVIRAQVDNLLSSIFDYAGLGETGETVLARPEGDGYVFLAPTRFEPGAALTPVPQAAGDLEHCLMFEEQAHTSCIDYRGREVLVVGRLVPDTDWVVAVKLDRAEAYRRLDRMTAAAGGLTLVLMIAVGAAALRFGRKLAEPLVELGTAAGSIAAGDYSSRVPVRSTDEIGALERDFNSMADQIAAAQQTMARQVEDLNHALAEIKTLRGIIPICAGCKKIRDDQGMWNQLEAYLLDHSDAEFSHGLCPDCLKIYDPYADKDTPGS